MTTGDSQAGVLYRVRWRGHVSGPFPLDRIVRMIRENQLSQHHEISSDGRYWRTLAKSGMMGQPCAIRRPDEMTIPPKGAHSRLNDLETGSAAPHGVARISDGESIDDGASRDCSFIAGCAPSRASDAAPNASLTISAKRGMSIAAMGVAPLAISFLQILLGLSFAQVAWLFSAYFCFLWGWIIGLLTTWRSDIWRKGVWCSIFTCFIGIAMLLIWQNIPWVAALYSGAESDNPFMRLIGFVVGVGIMEELCKAAPLLIFCIRPGIIRSSNDGLLLGLLSGLGFAVREGVQYTMSYWSTAVGIGAASIHRCVEEASNWYGVVDQDVFAERLGAMLPQLFEQYGQIVTMQLVRFMTLPVLHAAWAALVGYAVALSLIQRRWIVMWAGLGMAALLHGVYNFFSNSIYGVGVAGASLAIPLLLYTREHSFIGEGTHG